MKRTQSPDTMNHHLKLLALTLAAGYPTARAEPPAPAHDFNSTGTLYQTARDLLKAGVAGDEAVKGFGMMREAAGKGYLPAIAGLGFLYSTGLGVAKDNAEAAKWFRLAAEQEHTISRYNLGKLLIADEVPLAVGSTDRSAQHAEGVEWWRIYSYRISI